MQTLIKIFFIFFFFWLGEFISYLMGEFVPGSVIGMILLFLALQTKLIKEEHVDTPAKAYGALLHPCRCRAHGSDGCRPGQLVGHPRSSRRQLHPRHRFGGLRTRTNGKEA